MKTLLAALILGLSSARAEELTLFVRAPKETVDWSTPGALVRTAIWHAVSFGDSFLGSAWVELTCGTARSLVGVRPLRTSFLGPVLIHGQGLGAIVQNFPGAFEELSDLEEERRRPDVRFLTLKLSPLQCQRALRYLAEFRKYKVERNYSLAVKPRSADGASAASFAVSFLEVLNLLDQEMVEHWTRTLQVPATLAGPPLKEQTVGVLDLLSHLDSWARDGEESIAVRFLDPGLIHRWITQKLVKNIAPGASGPGTRAEGIILDRGHYPTPEDPLWRQQIDPSDKRKIVTPARPTRPPKKSRPLTGDEPVIPN